VLGAFAYVAIPRVDDSAFARQQAADAVLLPRDGSILHVEILFTETGETEQFGHDPRLDLNQRWAFWLDPKGERSREEMTNVEDGSLDQLSVRSGDRIRTFANNVRYGTGDSPQLMEWNQPGEPVRSPMGPVLDYVSAEIASGAAKVVGSKTIDGEEYWVVEMTMTGDAQLEEKSVATVTLRKSDYRIKSFDRVDTMKNGNGRCKTVTHFEFAGWQTIAPGALPEGIFSLEAPVKAAPKGTKIEIRDETLPN